MKSILDRILVLNLMGTTVVFYVAARLYIIPRLDALTTRSVLLPILLLHSLRHLGLMFLTRGAIYQGMPQEFAWPAAVGDLVTAVLAFCAIPAVAGAWTSARALVWLFNIVGTVDLISAISLATVYDAQVFMGPAYWIPVFQVPSLLVTHYLTFVVLRRPWQ